MIDFNKATTAIKMVREEYAQLCLRPDDRPINIPFLLMAVESYTEKQIEVVSVPVAGHQIKGMIRRYDGLNNVQIIYSDKLNTCWTRFVLVKELAHLLFDTDGCFVNSVEQANDLIGTLIFPGAPKEGHLTPEYLSEQLAQFGALEILFPQADREVCLRQMQNGEKGSYDIAVEYLLPKRFVEAALTPEWSHFLRALFA